MAPLTWIQSIAQANDRRSLVAAGVAVAILVSLGGALGFELAVPQSGVATLWPPAGIVLGVLLVAPVARWGWLAAAAAIGGMTADLLWGARGWVVPGAALANVGESLLAAGVVRTLIGERVTLGSLRQVALLLFGGSIAANALSSAAGAMVLGRGSTEFFARNWLIWFIGDGLGMLVFAPLAVRTWRWMKSNERVNRNMLEAAALVAILVPIAVAVLRLSEPVGSRLPVYGLFPLLVWIGARHGVFAASAASATLAVTLLATLVHTPAFSSGSTTPHLTHAVDIYLFILVGTVTALTPAALIEERQRAYRRLTASERRFFDLANCIHEAFFVVDLDRGSVAYANAAASGLLTAKPGSPFDPSLWLARVHPDDRAQATAQARVLAHGQVADATLRLPGHDSEWRWLHVRAYPVSSDHPDAHQVACVAADVTALRSAEEQLRHAQKMEAVGQFASGIVHDFNNLLSVTLMAADTLETDLPADSQALQEVAAIRVASDRAAQLARHLLRFSRQEPAARQRIALHDLLREIVPLLSRLVGSSVQYAMALEADADTIYADSSDVEQILFNLCKNARDAMPQGGHLRIATARAVLGAGETPGGAPREAIALTVQDTGVGIEPTTMPRIFEPFFTTKEGGQGTGLGLATVQRIVQQHGGHIDVVSEQGRGTTFVVKLPLAPPIERVVARN